MHGTKNIKVVRTSDLTTIHEKSIQFLDFLLVGYLKKQVLFSIIIINSVLYIHTYTHTHTCIYRKFQGYEICELGEIEII